MKAMDETTHTHTAAKKSADYFLPISILVAGVLVAGSVFYLVGTLKNNQQGTGTPPDTNTGVVGESPELASSDVILGDPNAPVAIIEYGDYQCPFCARFFEETEKQIRRDFVESGKVKFVFRNFQFLGPESQAAGEAAECAKDQNKFWAYHDALYTAELADGAEHNGNLNRTLFMKIAGDLQMNTTEFGQCIDTHKYAQRVETETQEASSKYGVNSTPTAFVNGERIVGAMPYDGAITSQVTPFKPVIEKHLED